MFTILQTPTLSFCKINLITALNHPFSSCDYWENGRFMSLTPSVPRKEGLVFPPWVVFFLNKRDCSLSLYNLTYLHIRTLHIWPVGIHLAHHESPPRSCSSQEANGTCPPVCQTRVSRPRCHWHFRNWQLDNASLWQDALCVGGCLGTQLAFIHWMLRPIQPPTVKIKNVNYKTSPGEGGWLKPPPTEFPLIYPLLLHHWFMESFLEYLEGRR